MCTKIKHVATYQILLTMFVSYCIYLSSACIYCILQLLFSKQEKIAYSISVNVFFSYLVHTTQVSSLSLQGMK